MANNDVNAYWRKESRYYKEPRTPEDRAEQQQLYDQAQAVGEWERSHRVSDLKRITWWHPDFGSFVPKDSVTPEQLKSRYNEITETVTSVITANKTELNETEQNFQAWMAVTESSRYRWVEDEIYRLNGRGAMYYTGGEDGVYMRIHKDGNLEAGSYEGAIPHIGEAIFKPAVTKEYSSFSEAYKAAMEVGGKQFMIDMFSGDAPQPLIKTTSAPEEKPSVLKQIREAQKAPKPQRGDQSPDKLKSKGDVDL